MNNDRQYLLLFILPVIVVSIFIAFFAFRQQNDALKPLSTLDVNPSDSTSEGITVDPVVKGWRTYAHTQYSFSLEVPMDWNEQEYLPLQPTGGTLIAFSQDTLPCKTCSYFRDGFFSVKVYSEKSDPDFYRDFMQRSQSVGKREGYQGVVLGGKNGVLFGNVAAVENQGWVYEISLDTNDGNGKIIDSQIMQKVLSSLSFTHLLFGE